MNPDIFYKKIFECVKKTNLTLEMAYDGNVGLHEMCKFFQVATELEVKQFEQLMANNNIPDAWELIQVVTKTRLKGL